MRIGELARRAGVSRDAIRFYERQGLIEARSGAASSNNYKDYPEEAVFTLEVVRDAQSAGMSIADLSILLGQLYADDGDDFDGDQFLADKIAEVEERLAASERFLQTLKETRTALRIAPLSE
ncbi:MAG: MerR family transcriptional regulator [Boseongicola sp.]|nr:MAG: MerR family transcriptional regulator [Boseongicola sp.]